MISALFLGSGGARFVVARQLRASGGMWLTFGETQIHVDPGPGALVRALTHVPPCNPRDLQAIVLSHKHLDHAGDVNAMIEAMTSGGFRKRGLLLAPADAFDADSIVLAYARAFVEQYVTLEASSGPYGIGDVELRTSTRHHHGVDTYGMHFSYNGQTVSYLPCGKYFDGLAEDYRAHNPDVLIVNVLRFADGMNVDHLTWDQACSVVAEVKPRVAVFQHFGTQMLERQPEHMAQELEDELGIRVIAAYDNLSIDLSTEMAAACA
ncbi:MAG: MBL fold metallo-hydrolase [Vulcanimicrobiaceae bacterium]